MKGENIEREKLPTQIKKKNENQIGMNENSWFSNTYQLN